MFLVPYILGRMYNFNVSIKYNLSNTNKELPNFIRGVKLNPMKSKMSIINYILVVLYLLNNSKNINVVMFFHVNPCTFLYSVVYKFINPKGVVYVKGDLYLRDKNELKTPLKLFLKKVDLLTVESIITYNTVKEIVGRKFEKKIEKMMNFFDEEEFEKIGIKIKDIAQKENIILTVGRLGSRQKNTEMILKAIPKVELKEWKLIFIGPVEGNETNFAKTIDQFYKNNPELKNKVIFTGAIYDKKELWAWSSLYGLNTYT